VSAPSLEQFGPGRDAPAVPGRAFADEVPFRILRHVPQILPIDSLTAQKRMVEAGFGLALLPASSVDEELRSGTLCPLRVTAMRATIPVALIHRRRAFQSGATKALSALLAAWPQWA
jgi:DNA-binding transcriptional LysR family regulator